MSKFTIKESFTPNQQSGTRIDKLLAENFSNIPREIFKKAIKDGRVLVNKNKTKPNYITSEHDLIEIDVEFEDIQTRALPDKTVEINIIYQHKDFLIIEKPAGISVHPGGKEKLGTIANGLLAKFPEIKNIGENPLRPGIVHRLDKYTSGLLVIPLSQTSFDFFKFLFKNRQITKKYTAICWGKLAKKELSLDSYIGRSSANALKQTTSKEKSKVGNAKRAITNLKQIKTNNEQKKSLVIAIPKTGRKHQIRVHLSSIGNPLVGDRLYQTERLKSANESFDRFFLHANFLAFTYRDGKKYEFESPLPKSFAETLEN